MFCHSEYISESNNNKDPETSRVQGMVRKREKVIYDL
ncbi:hypothetical protein C8P64_0366 [Christiangramia gaetbulicola]|uniref:Uncharacterized protein n=1 Tax=Christiangramia gaetbulicola TaxID=703340 RepID=A0A2T6AKR8_9FLAO|nr:hypothetical protein C8P64_0366 [Christiangramia gaetbulicola]